MRCMKRPLAKKHARLLGLAVAGCVAAGGAAQAAIVSPIVADLGTYPPFKNNDNTAIDSSVNNPNNTSPFYVKFQILQDSNFEGGIKADSQVPLPSAFNIVNYLDGTNVVTGCTTSNTCQGSGPFNKSSLDFYIAPILLAKGIYAFQIAASDFKAGNDYQVRVTGNISAVPLPAGILLFGTALAGFGFMRRRADVQSLA
jgi:hypothetical protein